MAALKFRALAKRADAERGCAEGGGEASRTSGKGSCGVGGRGQEGTHPKTGRTGAEGAGLRREGRRMAALTHRATPRRVDAV